MTNPHKVEALDAIGEEFAAQIKTGVTAEDVAALTHDAFIRAYTVYSVHALDALPVGTIAIDKDGDPWRKLTARTWIGGPLTDDLPTIETSLQLEAWAPLFIVPTTLGGADL